MITPEEHLKECLNILENNVTDDGTPNACKIHDAFGGLDGEHHNCLGCNFAESTDLILNYLRKNESFYDVQQSFIIYILLLYLLTERFEIIFNIIQLPDTYKTKHFKVFQQIRKWSNFIKHPKSFILTHHPEYDFENSESKMDLNSKILINDQFVESFYKGQSDPEKQKRTNKKLYETLKNQRNVIVIFPDMTSLTKKFSYSYNKFIDVICKNEAYVEILNDESTISSFFENEN